MKIGIVCPCYIPTPPLLYGGIERVSWDRAVEMGRLGHKITLIASKGSARPPRGRLIETVDARMDFNDEQPAYNIYRKYLDDFDVIIDDSHMKFSYLRKVEKIGGGSDLPVMGVLHTHPTYRTPPSMPDGTRLKANFVAVSKHHALKYSGVFGIVIKHCYNGVSLEKYGFQKNKGERFLWVGRFEPFKGAHIAVYVCKSLGVPLDLVGKHSDTPPAYFNQVMVEVNSVPFIRYLGEVDEPTLIQLYQNARAVIMPTLWEEPLGLVQLEAQSCGTPVVSTTLGPMAETIVHGETGFLANGVEEMGECLGRVDEIEPENCREWIKKRFSKSVMAKRYEQLCYQVARGETW